MKKRPEDAGPYCFRCRACFLPGDVYYDVPGEGTFCPDCAEALLEGWRRTEGDAVDRI